MTPNESVIAKIRKLLSLANNNPSEIEAALAMARAQEMMAAYNLEIHELESKSNAPVGTTPESRRTKFTHGMSGLFEYQRSLWEAVARVNMCWYEAIPEYKINTLGVRLKANYHHYLIGSEVNVLSATIMAEYLEEVIKRLCPYRVGKPMFSWREGCAARLVERLNAKRYEMENESERAKSKAQQEASSVTALVTLSDVFQSEDDLNYRERHGQEAYERRLSFRHNQEACMCPHCARRREQDRRWKEEDAKLPVVPEKQETDTQRRKREEAERKRSDRYWDAQDRKEKRKWAGKDMGAYREGETKGSEINIDQQIKSGEKGKLR